MLANLNHQAGIGKDALVSFVDELEWSVERDPALSRYQKGTCKHQIKAARENLGEPGRIAKSLAGLRISLGDYYQSIVRGIGAIIKDEPSKKDNLVKLSASFIAQAEFRGYPRRHTYHVVKEVIYKRLHLKEVTVDDIDVVLSDFFGRFEGRSKYSCTMIANDTVRRYPKMLHAFGIELTDNVCSLSGLNDRQKGFLEKKREDECFLVVKDIDAVCAVQAQEVASFRFESLSSTINYIEHRVELKRSKLSLVERIEEKKKFIVRDDIDPMHGWSQVTQDVEGQLDWLYDALNGRHFVSESQYRVARATQFHADALQATSNENKLIDLWAGLEGLLSTPRKGVPKIEFFAECILPSLTMSYPRRIFSSLYAHVLKRNEIINIIKDSVQGSSDDFRKFIVFVALEKYVDEQEVVCSSLKGINPLLLNRFALVHRQFSSVARIRETLFEHRKKVKWHVERIYAMRNSIMHNARAMPHLATLVSNLHEYMDALLFGLTRVAVDARERVSVEGALQHMAAAEAFRLERLKEFADEGVQLDEKSLLEVVLESE